MLDRESTFAHPQIVKLLKTKFVPVALDQAYQRRQKDAEGDFYRKIAAQGPRDINGTTQGFYVARPDGTLMLYNNNRHPEKVARLLKESIQEFDGLQAEQKTSVSLDGGAVDKRYNPIPPAGGLIVRVNAKVLSGYEETDDRWRQIFQSAISRDNLWITKQEHASIIGGTFPENLQIRIARFHLVDNTRGEPQMWKRSEIKSLDLSLQDNLIAGGVHLERADGSKGFVAELRGRIESQNDRVTDLKMVCQGEYWGEGRYTRGAPKGRFPLAIGFTLADGTDTADAIPPQGSRGWVDGYLDANR